MSKWERGFKTMHKINFLETLEIGEMSKEILLNNELPNQILNLQEILNISAFDSLHKEFNNLDLKALCDKEYECDQFIWVVRECGTSIYPEQSLFLNNSQEHLMFKYFAGYDRAIFRINVTKRDIANNEVYGKITPLNTNLYTEKVFNESKEANNALCKVLTQDGKKIIETIDIKDGFINSNLFTNTLKRDYMNIKKIYFLKYFN